MNSPCGKLYTLPPGESRSNATDISGHARVARLEQEAKNSMSESKTATPDADTARRFIFEDADIRGQRTVLNTAYQAILEIHQYAPGVSRLLGEFLAASVLLSTTLKFEGKIILQVRSEGQIPLLMTECNGRLEIRGIARGAEEATALHNEQLLTNGQLVITIDPTEGQRYQGIVPLEEGSLANSLDHYFEKSEQLCTRIWLAADGEQASGFLLQQLPAQVTASETDRADQWEHVCSLASTLTESEVLELDSETLLYRVFHEDALRLFDPQSVQFRCNCSRDRTQSALVSLGKAEILEMLEDLGVITMDCEFCNQQYQFNRDDLAETLGASESKTLH
jgi:molecular chaperone Hsp33